MSLYPVAGCKIYIGGVLADKNADFTAADFSSQTWTEIDGWEQMGAYGDTAQVITTSLINRGRDIKQKGTRNAGQMQNVFSVIADDDGQIALIAAEKTSNNYAFKIELNDAPSGGTPTTIFNRGMVAGPRIPFGRNEDFITEVYTLALQQQQIIVDAAA